jgi:hypothetical protein
VESGTWEELVARRGTFATLLEAQGMEPPLQSHVPGLNRPAFSRSE